jgi:hypothetical protein
MTTEQGPGYLADIPGALVVRSQQDIAFAVKLLHRDTREEALREAELDLTEEERSQLDSRLDEIARLSFQDAIGALGNEGVAHFA